MHELFLCGKCVVGGVGRASWAAHLPGFVLPAPLSYQAYASSEQCTSSILPIFSAMGPVNPHELPVILLSRFDDAFPGVAPLALKAATNASSWRLSTTMS